jgi:hypothetical protein
MYNKTVHSNRPCLHTLPFGLVLWSPARQHSFTASTETNMLLSDGRLHGW